MGLTLISPGAANYAHNLYVSISKQADSTYIQRVLNTLKHVKINVYTYDGNDYDLEDLTHMDYMVVIPPTRPVSALTERIDTLGKGQMDEITYFMDYIQNKERIFISFHLDQGLKVSELRSITPLKDSPDWTKAGSIRTLSEGMCLSYHGFHVEPEYYESNSANAAGWGDPLDLKDDVAELLPLPEPKIKKRRGHLRQYL